MVNIGCVQVIFSGKIVMFDENLGTIKADKFVTYYIRSDAVKITVKKQWSLLHHFLKVLSRMDCTIFCMRSRRENDNPKKFLFIKGR